MSSFLNFINTASNVLSDVLGAFAADGDGCIFTLSGNGESVDFPVSPPDFEVSNSYNNTTLNINNLGEINMLGKRGLVSLKFSSFFPNQPYTFVQSYSDSGPYDYVASIKKMAESGRPCRIAISSTDVSLPVSIEAFDYNERDSTGDVYFTLSLKEYRYIRPDSTETNDTTELKSRVSEKLETKDTTCFGSQPGGLDTAQRVIQKTATIAKQGERTLGLYKAMVKSGGIPLGTVLRTTAKGVTKGGKPLYKF